jgi:hypothetical protein
MMYLTNFLPGLVVGFVMRFTPREHVLQLLGTTALLLLFLRSLDGPSSPWLALGCLAMPLVLFVLTIAAIETSLRTPGPAREGIWGWLRPLLTAYLMVPNFFLLYWIDLYLITPLLALLD